MILVILKFLFFLKKEGLWWKRRSLVRSIYVYIFIYTYLLDSCIGISFSSSTSGVCWKHFSSFSFSGSGKKSHETSRSQNIKSRQLKFASFQGGLRSHFSRNVTSSTSHIEGLVTLV